jgi:hypothetical protein
MMPSSPIKILSFFVCTINVVFIPVLMWGVIWFDKYGSDQKRTLIDRLTSSMATVAMELTYVIQMTELIRFTSGPMPKVFCFFKTIARATFQDEILLFMNAMAISKYLFIFHLKNPFAFQDEFWCFFINTWVRAASWLINIVKCLSAERQSINYYICTGEDPTKDFKKPAKTTGIIGILSVLIHIFVFIKIQIYKMSNPNFGANNGSFINDKYLADLKTQAVEFISVNVINTLVLGLFLISVSYLSRLEPEKLCQHATFLYVHYLIALSGTLTVFYIMHYVHYKQLRNFVFCEIKEFLLRNY